MTRMTKSPYHSGVNWIAHNDDEHERDLTTIEQQITVLMLADMFERPPEHVAEDVLKRRVTLFGYDD